MRPSRPKQGCGGMSHLGRNESVPPPQKCPEVETKVSHHPKNVPQHEIFARAPREDCISRPPDSRHPRHPEIAQTNQPTAARDHTYIGFLHACSSHNAVGVGRATKKEQLSEQRCVVGGSRLCGVSERTVGRKYLGKVLTKSGQCQIQEGSVRNVKFSRCAARNKDVQGCPMGRNECVPPLKRVPGTHLVGGLVQLEVQG